jgi:hypothetical protein
MTGQQPATQTVERVTCTAPNGEQARFLRDGDRSAYQYGRGNDWYGEVQAGIERRISAWREQNPDGTITVDRV